MAVRQIHAKGLAGRLFFQQAGQQARLATPGFGRLGRLIECEVNPGDLVEKLRGLSAHPRVVALLGKQLLVESEGFLQHGLPGAVQPRSQQQVAPQPVQPVHSIADDSQMALGPRLLLTGRIPFPPEGGGVLLCLGGVSAGALPLPENAGAAGQEDEHQRGHQHRDARVAAAPDDDPLARPHGAGPDRLAGPEAPEVVSQVLGGGITAAGFLPQALQANGFEVARHGRLEASRRHRLVLPHQAQRRINRRRRERRATGQGFVEDGPQAVNVHRRGDGHGLARRLLRGHVTGRTDHVAAVRQVAAGHELGQAEVGDLGAEIGGQRHAVEKIAGRAPLRPVPPLRLLPCAKGRSPASGRDG